MITINIIDSNDFRDKSWTLKGETDNQIILSLLDSVEHFHAIRFPLKKIIWVTNLNEREINYLIELSPLRHSEPDRHTFNETSFFFGGDDNSLYQFSNINIKAIVREPFRYIDGTDKQVFKDKETNVEGEIIEITNLDIDGTVKQVFKDKETNEEREIIEITNLDDLPCPELLFMIISHHSKLTFFNCVFHNNTDKNYKIETWHNAVVEFINCEFRGKFIFNSNHDSIIVRH